MIRVDGVCSLFLKLYTITDTKGRRSGIVSAKYRARATAQNDRKMCKECSELTETYRDEKIHPRYHVYYNGDKNNSKTRRLQRRSLRLPTRSKSVQTGHLCTTVQAGADPGIFVCRSKFPGLII